MAEISNSEQVALLKAESAELMASTDYWKELVEVLAKNEAYLLVDLEDYLSKEKYPAREDVVALCLRWHAYRTVRKLLLDNVEEARRVKAALTQLPYEPESWSESEAMEM